MNPNSLFGRPQGGAFQASTNTNKASMFQPAFGQQPSNNPPPTAGFGQTATFGQPSAFSQPPAFGQTTGQTSMFGQTAAFGQASPLGQGSVFRQSGGLSQAPTSSSTFSTMSQPPDFGQISMGQGSTGFSAPPPSYGQSTGKTQSSVFGQTPAFGQTSAFGQPSGFGQQSQGFGLAPASSGSTTMTGSTQPMSFSQSSFGAPLPTSAPSSFNAAPGLIPSRGFGMSEFSFKPANEALFKPIFSVSPEPANPQPKPSEQPFTGGSQAPSTMDSSGSAGSGFPLLAGAKSGPLGFSFSQPGAAPSISAPSGGLGQNESLAAGTSSGSPSTLQFTFSQPAAPTNTGTAAAPQPAAVPSSPSSFSFAPKVLQTHAAPPMSLFSFSKTPAFGELKTEAPVSAEERSGDQATTGEANVFSRLGKGTKRKEELVAPGSAPAGNPAREEDPQTDSDKSRHPPKRPLLRSRGPPGGALFRSAMSGLSRSTGGPLRREPILKDEAPQQGEMGETEIVETSAPSLLRSATLIAPTREATERVAVAAPEPVPEAKTPGRRAQRGESTDSLGGMSPTDLTVIQCKNVPHNLNRKDIIEKHFGRFGRVRKVMCRSNKNLVIVHFQDHASAAKARKKGKILQGHELQIFWQRKKHSPGGKGERPGQTEEGDQGIQASEPRPGGFQHSPVARPSPRTVSSLAPRSRSSPAKKSPAAKAIQFDSDVQQDAGSDSLGSERPGPSSLLHLVGQYAETAEDKYRLLEQRDKILRQGRPKRTDLDMAKVFVGTCPDMCPEKERYMRETRNQLSTFELVPNTEMVDHVAAIKEYSRSSADQEEPLPHELRPLPVLGMTMDYLVTQVLDHGQDNYGDWYDFLWNRTRGIRKDITQQHLRCPLTVSLIEKCARFHIHCAHHLCEESSRTFEAKINNENLTKCMQSLKEMYLDLANRGIYCPLEAEFRQYNVLMKLNNGDILREVQQFREEVRNSPEVKFAVQAYAALNSNNFVRFFKLVKAASYLPGCLLHGYFNQVRSKALLVLNTAYTVGSQRSTLFPLEDMVTMLLFTSTAEAASFIQQYGLNISDGMVELSRTAYQSPDSLSQQRSQAILAKRTVLIGEVVNGGPLPNPPQHTPVCSFDSHNKFRGAGPLAEPPPPILKFPTMGAAVPAFVVKPEVKPQAEVEARPQLKPARLLPEAQLFVEPQAVPEPVQPAETGVLGGAAPHPADPPLLFQPVAQLQPIRPLSPPPKPEPTYTEEDMQAEVQCVVEEVVGEAVCDVARAGADYVASALSESSDQVEVLLSEVVEQLVREASTSEIQLEQQIIAAEKRKMEEARRKQEHEAFLAQFSASLCSEISQEVLSECIQETAASEIQLALAEKAEHFARCSEEVCTSLVEETLDGEIALLVEDVLEVELHRIHKYIRRWRDVVAVRRQLKRQMRGFPAAPCCVDPRFKLQALAPSAPSQASLEVLARGMVNLGNTGTLALSSTRLLKMRQDTIHQMKVHYHFQQLLSETVWTPLDLLTMVTENIPNPPDRIFWKVTLLLPSDHESVACLADRILSDWLEVKLGGGKETEDSEQKTGGLLRTLCISNGLREREQRTHKVHVSVKVSRGPLSEDGLSKMEELSELQGTGALLMLLPALPDPELGCQDQDVPLLSALLQLKQLQQASAWHCLLPLVILVPGSAERLNDTHKLEEELMLPTLVEDGLISEYVFICIPETTSDLQGSEQLGHAVRWLLAHTPAPSPLSSQTLVQFVEAGLCREFSSRLYRHRRERVEAGLPYQNPAPVIQLYNAVLAHLADTVSSQHLSSLSWPPGEFAQPDTRGVVPHLGWNSARHLAWLRTTILSLQIPVWDLPSSTASWPQLCSSIFQYSSGIPASRCSQPLLMSRLENLLERVRLQGQTPGEALEDWEEQEKHGPSFSQVPWEEVLALCIDHKLKDWQPPEDPVCEDAVTEDGDILVYYLSGGLKGFEPPTQWLEAVRLTHQEKLRETDGGAGPGDEGLPAPQSVRQRLFQRSSSGPEPSAPPLDVTHTPSPQELLPLRVLDGLKEERAQSQRCVEQLQRWLKVDCLDTPSLPLFMPSTLLSIPAGTTLSSPVAGRPSSGIQDVDTDEQSEKAEAGWLRSSPLSMTQRLKEIQRQILASREEDLACSLKLTSLLNIVGD